MMFNKILFLLVACAVLLTPACSKNEDSATGDCGGLMPTYSADIKPIIDGNCMSCHNGPQSVSGIDLSTYNGVKAKLDQGRLLGAIQHQDGFVPMPKDSPKLSADKIQLFVCWAENGSLQ